MKIGAIYDIRSRTGYRATAKLVDILPAGERPGVHNVLKYYYDGDLKAMQNSRHLGVILKAKPNDRYVFQKDNGNHLILPSNPSQFSFTEKIEEKENAFEFEDEDFTVQKTNSAEALRKLRISIRSTFPVSALRDGLMATVEALSSIENNNTRLIRQNNQLLLDKDALMTENTAQEKQIKCLEEKVQYWKKQCYMMVYGKHSLSQLKQITKELEEDWQ